MFYADNCCKCIEEYEPEHTYTFIGKWMDSGEEHKVTVKGKDLFKYRQGELIQRAFPYLSIKDREFLLTGMYIEMEEDFEDALQHDQDPRERI